MSSGLISVIMSVYNEKEYWLRDAIDSILNQTYDNFEFIIIIDNPNNTNIINLLYEYEKIDNRIKVHLNDRNLGLVKSLNKGLKLAKGEFIARMDADDISEVTRFEEQIDFLQRNENVDLCATGVVIMNEDGEELYKANLYGDTVEKAYKSLVYRNIFPHGSWMFRRRVLAKIKEYNEINQAEDYDLLFRLLSEDGQICILPRYLFKYRLRENGISFNNLYKQKKVMQQLSKTFVDSKLNNRKYITPNNINNITFSELEIESYNKYQKLYTDGISEIRNKKYLTGTKKILKSIAKSEDKRTEIESMMMLKLVNKL